MKNWLYPLMVKLGLKPYPDGGRVVGMPGLRIGDGAPEKIIPLADGACVWTSEEFDLGVPNSAFDLGGVTAEECAENTKNAFAHLHGGTKTITVNGNEYRIINGTRYFKNGVEQSVEFDLEEIMSRSDMDFVDKRTVTGRLDCHRPNLCAKPRSMPPRTCGHCGAEDQVGNCSYCDGEEGECKTCLAPAQHGECEYCGTENK